MSAILVIVMSLAPQAAPVAADLADAKCAATMISVSGQLTDPQQKAGVDRTMMFFLGKIVDRSGGAAVKPALEVAAA